MAKRSTRRASTIRVGTGTSRDTRERGDEGSSGPGRSVADLPAGTDLGSVLISLLLAVLSGSMWFIATADFDIWPLAYVALLPLLWLIARAPTRRHAWLYGWVSGIVANTGGFYWITGLLTRFAGFSLPLAVLGLLLLAAYQGVVFLLFALAVRRIREVSEQRLGRPLPMVLLAPVVMVAFEMLIPFIFPWYLAITQAWVIPIIQIAEITGPVGISALLSAVSGALHDAASERGRRRICCLAGGAGFLAVVLVFGYVRMGQIEARRQAAHKLPVGVVQGNIGFDEKGIDKPDRAAEQLAELQAESAELAGAGAELIMWSETAYPYVIPRRQDGSIPPIDPAIVRDGFSVPLLFGSVTMERGDNTDDVYPHNSALLLDREGTLHGPYDKMFLLMFGEYIPGLETFPFIRKIMPRAAGHFARGTRTITFPLTVDGVTYRLGPMICYEDILPAFGRTLAAKHPHLLVNVTNDAWFGDTSEPWQHLALSVFRAVELRTDLVRAVNTGVSAFIDATGRVSARTYAVDPQITPRGVDGILATAVLMEGGHGFYARFGDVFGYLCVALTLLMWLLWPRLRVRNRG